MQKGVTPFHLAAQRGNLEISKLFIETLDDINPKGIYDRLPVINNQYLTWISCSFAALYQINRLETNHKKISPLINA